MHFADPQNALIRLSLVFEKDYFLKLRKVKSLSRSYFALLLFDENWKVSQCALWKIHNKKAFQSNVHRLLSDSLCFIVNKFEREVEVAQRGREELGACTGTPPPKQQNRKTDTVENITFPQFRWREELFVVCHFFEKDLNVHMIQSVFRKCFKRRIGVLI